MALLISILLHIFVVPILAQAKQQTLLKISISASDATESSGRIMFSLKNISPIPIEILPWGTPLEGIFTNKSFTITKDNQKVKYLGLQVKRRSPQDTDYITVNPGESLSAEIKLTEGYLFTEAGEYSVRFTGLIYYRQPEKKSLHAYHGKFSSNLLILKISPPKSKVILRETSSAVTCTTSQQTTLSEILKQAQSYASNAADVLSSTDTLSRSGSGRYSAWFGEYSTERYSLLNTQYSAISSALQNETIEFACECTIDALAYVYPNEPFRIYLCNDFWNIPISGKDSQAGVVIHEMSHFDVTAATDDYIYGAEGSFSLAQENPLQAVNNADNFEYFAENSPFLPMTPIVALNDQFSDSQQTHNISLYSLALTNNASKEINEPDHASIGGGKSVWLSWVAPASGEVHVTTRGSTFDTLLAIYTGDSIDALTPIVSNDDTADSSQSEVVFSSQTGLTYHIAFDGYGGDSGLAYLALVSNFGDINGDIILDLKDPIIALQMLTGSLSADVSTRADINSDNKIGIEEALFVLKQIAD